MEALKLLILSAILFVVITDVIARPMSSKSSHLEELVEDIDSRLKHRSAHRQSRRRRRHITQTIALMDFCYRYPSRCRHEIERLRRQQQTQSNGPVVVIIQK